MVNFSNLLLVIFLLVSSCGGCGSKKVPPKDTGFDTDELSKDDLEGLSRGISGSFSPEELEVEKAIIQESGSPESSSKNVRVNSVQSIRRVLDLTGVKSDFSYLVSAGVPISILYDRVQEYLSLDAFNAVGSNEKKNFLDGVGKSLIDVYNLHYGNSSSECTKEKIDAIVNPLSSNFISNIGKKVTGLSDSDAEIKTYITRLASNYCTNLKRANSLGSVDTNFVKSNGISDSLKIFTNRFYLFPGVTLNEIKYYYNGSILSNHKDLSLSRYSSNGSIKKSNLDANFFSNEQDLKKGVFTDFRYNSLNARGYLRGILVDGVRYFSADNYKYLFDNGKTKSKSFLQSVKEAHIFIKKWPEKYNLSTQFNKTNGYILRFVSSNGEEFSFSKLFEMQDNGQISNVTSLKGVSFQSSNFFIGRGATGMHYVTPSKIVCKSCTSSTTSAAQEADVLQVDCGKTASTSCGEFNASTPHQKFCVTKKNSASCGGEISYKEFTQFEGSVLLLSAIDAVQEFQKYYKVAVASGV